MPVAVNVPRVRRGDVLYRVEWNKNDPVLARYDVVSGTVLSIVVRTSAGKEQILVGRNLMSQFAISPEQALVAEFERIAREALRHERDATRAFRQVLQLGSLLPGKKQAAGC